MALVSAALCLPAATALAGGGGGRYHSPPPTTRQTVRTTQETRYYLPPGAPLARTYTWYAPPAGYEVIREGTPAAPGSFAAVGPDGVQRTYPLEGPVVTRIRYQVVGR
jgi:hypothetical protein